MRKWHYWCINFAKMSSGFLEKKSSMVHRFWRKKKFTCSRILELPEYYFDPVAYNLHEDKSIPLSISLELSHSSFSVCHQMSSPPNLLNCCSPAPSHELLEVVNSCFPHCRVATMCIVSKRCWFMEWSVSSIPEAGWVTLEGALCSLSLNLSSYFPCLHVSHFQYNELFPRELHCRGQSYPRQHSLKAENKCFLLYWRIACSNCFSAFSIAHPFTASTPPFASHQLLTLWRIFIDANKVI